MLTNYLKIAFRSLLKNRVYSFINIVGLATGLAASILILLWVAHERSYDRFHKKLPQLHIVLQNQQMQNELYTFSAITGPLGPALKAEMPEVKNTCRTSWPGRHLISAGPEAHYERTRYAEPSLFQMFTFPALEGDPVAALSDMSSAVITERTAKKLFGDNNAIGKIIRHNNQTDLKVGAVIRDLPGNSSLQFDVVLPFGIFEKNSQGFINNWGSNSLPLWLETHPGADLAALNTKMENYIQTKNAEAAAHVFAYPWSKWRLESEFKEGKPDGGRIDIVRLFLIIGISIVLIACINFMNLATARSEKRAREVGVRKVVGAHRGLLVGQFLGEAMLMTFIALALAVLIVAVSLPAFNRFTEKTLSIGFSNWQLWAGLLAGGLFTGLAAGSYPALFLSRFQPIRTLKGMSADGGKRGALLRKGLVTTQFCFSIVLIISTMVIRMQMEHAQNRPLGFEPEALITIPTRGDMMRTYEAFKADLTALGGVKSVAVADNNLVMFGSNTSGFRWPGKTEEQEFLITMAYVGLDYLNTAGMKIKEGRDFYREFGGDTMSVILNETAVEMMGLKNPVGSVIRHDTTHTVVGVIEDFVYNNPFAAKPMPIAIMLDKHTDGNILVRFQNNENWRATLAQVETVFKKHNPAYPFDFRFTQEEFEKNFQNVKMLGQLGNLFGGLAILISCLGLFGLSAFMAERRLKEIGIRKVLGAGLANLWYQLSKDFLAPVALAFVVAAPLAGWLMRRFLQDYEYRIDVAWWVFAAAGVFAVVIALLTVSYQSVKAALTDPVKTLRSE
jgi:putative ABC transport system permease protein